jgi:REP element-mobilizing transposase RayT
MARPLRIEFPGALYHITSRGDRGEAIFEDDADREMFLRVVAEVVERYRWICHAFCLMTNHYHLVIETLEGNLSRGMRQLNGVYTQASNRRHRRTGHLFQGRFKGILVERDAYLLEVSRYVVLNPVRAGMVDAPGDWPWSSYRAMIGTAPVPKWLAVDALLGRFGEARKTARRRYQRFVWEGTGRAIWGELRQQIYLGDEAFVQRMQAEARIGGDPSSVARAQRRPPAPTLAGIVARHPERDAAILAAYATGAYGYREIAEHFGLHLATVRRIVRRDLQQCENW